jgi:uncharacterized protein DUF6894
VLPPTAGARAIPRYFFHVYDGHSDPDKDGMEMADIYQAQAQAIKMSGEILRDMGAEFWDGTAWRMEVADESGRVLFTLRFSAEEHDPKS